tara:strand:+ start:1256 stop:2038 length:783 start_codon:yes stop_codon:yes gene_type:complete
MSISSILKSPSYIISVNKPFHKYFKRNWPGHNVNVNLDKGWHHLVFLIDNSKYMKRLRGELIISSIRKFVVNQHIKTVTCSIFTFDDKCTLIYDDYIFDINNFIISKSCIDPRGTKSLTEATAFAIEYTGRKLAALRESRPAKITFVTISTSMEKTSHAFWSNNNGKDKLLRLVNEHKYIWGWSFYLLGTNINSIDDGEKIGYDKDKCINFYNNNICLLYAMDICSKAVKKNCGFNNIERSKCNPNFKIANGVSLVVRKK